MDSEVLLLALRFQGVSVSSTYPLCSDHPELTTKRPTTVTENLVDFVVPS